MYISLATHLIEFYLFWKLLRNAQRSPLGISSRTIMNCGGGRGGEGRGGEGRGGEGRGGEGRGGEGRGEGKGVNEYSRFSTRSRDHIN